MGVSVVGVGVVGPVAPVLLVTPTTGAGVVTSGSGGKMHLTMPELSRVMI